MPHYLEGLVPAVREFDRTWQQLAETLDEVGTLDPQTGAVEIHSEARMREAAVQAFGDEEGTVFADALLQIARTGFAITYVEEGGTNPIGVPWALLIDERVPPEVLHPALLNEVGIGPIPTPETTRRFLENAYPEAPAEFLTDYNLERLNQIAFSGTFLAGPGGSGPLPWMLNPKITIKSPTEAHLPPKPNTLDEFVVCFQTSEINAHLWGFEVCLDHDCAEKLADALLAVGVMPVVNALKSVVSKVLSGDTAALTVLTAAAIKTLGGAAVAALAVIGIYTAVSIKANNTPRGVCLQCFWPLWGGFIWWARGR
jgi:hypothetical protein